MVYCARDSGVSSSYSMPTTIINNNKQLLVLSAGLKMNSTVEQLDCLNNHNVFTCPAASQSDFGDVSSEFENRSRNNCTDCMYIAFLQCG